MIQTLGTDPGNGPGGQDMIRHELRNYLKHCGQRGNCAVQQSRHYAKTMARPREMGRAGFCWLNEPGYLPLSIRCSSIKPL